MVGKISFVSTRSYVVTAIGFSTITETGFAPMDYSDLIAYYAGKDSRQEEKSERVHLYVFFVS
jgi:hypothetical protein